MSEARFKIIFQKLAEVTADESGTAALVERLQGELDEIAELRRLSLEISQPEPQIYTTS